MEVNEMLVRAEFYTLNCIRISPIITDGYIKTSTEVCTVRSPLFLALGGFITLSISPQQGSCLLLHLYTMIICTEVYTNNASLHSLWSVVTVTFHHHSSTIVF